MSDERTLKPTTKRRQEARRQGRVAVSGSLVGSVSWLGLAALTSIFGAHAIVTTKQAVETLWNQPILIRSGDSLDLLRSTLLHVSARLVPLLCFIVATAILGRVAQVGFLWVPTRVLPQADRIQPSGARLAEWFSMDKLGLALRGFAVFTTLGAILAFGIWNQKNALSELMVSADIARTYLRFASHWGLQTGGCLFVIGLVDYAYQAYRFELSLQMTPEELRTEIQAIQENPQVSAGRRGLQQSIRSGNRIAKQPAD